MDMGTLPVQYRVWCASTSTMNHPKSSVGGPFRFVFFRDLLMGKGGCNFSSVAQEFKTFEEEWEDGELGYCLWKNSEDVWGFCIFGPVSAFFPLVAVLLRPSCVCLSAV